MADLSSVFKRISIVASIENAIVFMKRHLNEPRRVKGIEGRTELEIPEEVLREDVVNSLLHRDYLMTGANVENPDNLPHRFRCLVTL